MPIRTVFTPTRFGALAVAATIAIVMLALPRQAAAESIRFSWITKPPKAIYCGTYVAPVTVRVLPAERGRRVYLSHGYRRKWVDDSSALTNSAGIATLRFNTKCGSTWVGKQIHDYSINTYDTSAKKWKFKYFRLPVSRVVTLKTSGFGKCRGLAAGEESCVVAAIPQSAAFDLYSDDYEIMVWSVNPSTLNVEDPLTITDGQVTATRIAITESPFAFAILPFTNPWVGQVRITLWTASGDLVAWSGVYTVSWQ